MAETNAPADTNVFFLPGYSITAVAFWYVGLVAVAVYVVLSTFRACVYGLSATVIIRVHGVIPCNRTRFVGKRVRVARSGEVIPIGVVPPGFVVPLHISPVLSSVAVLVSYVRVGVDVAV